MMDLLIKEEIFKHLNTGINLQLFDSIDSTNLHCKRLAKINPQHGTLVVADTQTAGRGRMGRAFFSPEHTGIYMSLLIDSKRIKLSPSLLTVAAGVAVCRVLKKLCAIDAKIKWVNDIFVNNKKVCGILAENSGQYIIVGIGVNVSTAVFPDELKSIAGSVYPEGITRNEIIANIVNELHYIYMEDNSAKLIDEYKTCSCVLDKKISFVQNNKAYTGIATDINPEGNLVVHLDNGKFLTLGSGEVSLGSQSVIDKM